MTKTIKQITDDYQRAVDGELAFYDRLIVFNLSVAIIATAILGFFLFVSVPRAIEASHQTQLALQENIGG